MYRVTEKSAAALFFITREGWYSESGNSSRQTVGVTPDERHELREWPGQTQGAVCGA